MNAARLLDLALHLERGVLGHEKFCFTTYNGNTEGRCGTMGCAIGELPIIFPLEWGWREFTLIPVPLAYAGFRLYEGHQLSEDVGTFFDISAEDVRDLFHSNNKRWWVEGESSLSGGADQIEVALSIRQYVDAVGEYTREYGDIIEREYGDIIEREQNERTELLLGGLEDLRKCIKALSLVEDQLRAGALNGVEPPNYTLARRLELKQRQHELLELLGKAIRPQAPLNPSAPGLAAQHDWNFEEPRAE